MEEYIQVYSPDEAHLNINITSDIPAHDTIAPAQLHSEATPTTSGGMSQASLANEPPPPRKRRRRKEEKICKPQNAWLIYRKEFQEKLRASGSLVSNVAQVSSLASEAYAKLTQEEHEHYTRLAAFETEQLKLKHPNVKFTRRAKRKDQSKDQNTPAEPPVNPEKEGLSDIDKTFAAMLHSVSLEEDLGQDDTASKHPQIRMVESCAVDPSKLRPRLYPRSFEPPETDYSENPFSCFAGETPPNFERSYSLI
ncbi:hypothetical protein E3P99_01417 [Wallemia hederae]|uniref:HMG box domain-containing protein n=1 Tax=Wallemia hederae TaxID=1540922 RepID=A0A4T0FRD2_9BASI|nr:hypothetical protein E3P99_01417 [Wallemia hederae]